MGGFFKIMKSPVKNKKNYNLNLKMQKYQRQYHQ